MLVTLGRSVEVSDVEDDVCFCLQVPRADNCEFCLCLDGELFCWWQECPLSSSGPCKANKGYTACGNSSGPVSRSLGDGQDDTTTSLIAVTTSLSSPSSAIGPPRVTPEGAGNNQTAPEHQDVTTTTPTPAGTADDVTPTPAEPASSTSTDTCYVMGTEYKLGEVLPRDTGTCLECVCDSEARVTCSPKDCASQHDDFRSSNSLDMFDVDTF
uniref:(California timema) hypothetical protein n=1 Tax=Timema californicum TaxID=61474 RepID=A0A7R9PA35_TIMCA|nr:unnamed protein product [Timema californicum]